MKRLTVLSAIFTLSTVTLGLLPEICHAHTEPSTGGLYDCHLSRTGGSEFSFRIDTRPASPMITRPVPVEFARSFSHRTQFLSNGALRIRFNERDETSNHSCNTCTDSGLTPNAERAAIDASCGRWITRSSVEISINLIDPQNSRIDAAIVRSTRYRWGLVWYSLGVTPAQRYELHEALECLPLLEP